MWHQTFINVGLLQSLIKRAADAHPDALPPIDQLTNDLLKLEVKSLHSQANSDWFMTYASRTSDEIIFEARDGNILVKRT